MPNMNKKLNHLFEVLVDDVTRIIEEGDSDASVMQVARALIKDHNIQAPPQVAEDLSELSQHLSLHPGHLDEDDAATA